MQSECKKPRKSNVLQYFQRNIAKNTGFIVFFAIWVQKTKENQRVFNIFSKILQKALVFQCFLHSELKKQRKTNGFAIFSAKYSKKHRFYNVFCNLSSKNKGKPMVFQHVQQTIAKSTGFILFFAIWVQKNKKKLRLHSKGCIAKIA